ncbi:MAG: spore germination protein [Bacilli bacterium]|nr:spore germination protein [Bacilli bacterium]MBO5414152.1 spore germination protein [Bacilli bacterium]
MEKYIKYIKDLIGPSKDYIFRNIEIDKTNVFIGYNEVLASSSDINHFILKRMMTLTKKQLKSILNYLPTANTKEIKLEEAVYYLNNGFLVFIINKKVYASEVRRAIERGITTIESELSLTGPKDSFSEMFNTNLGLIRRRIKSDSLWWDELTLGTDTKTRVGIIYMNNIVDKKLIKDVSSKLNKINIDGIIDSAYLKDSLESNSLFPTISLTERSDKACMALLEGKIVIMVDTSSYVLILPNFFIDYFHTVDDYYQKSFNTTLIRVIRIFAFFIAIFIPAYYIAVTTYNQDSIFLSLLLLLKAQRASVPFPATIEALFMIISFEILRESDLRMSSTTGSAISILGGLILGDAAVSAGIMSPIMIIVIALSSIAGFVFTSIELVNAIRIYRIIFLILASLLGIYGIYLGAVYLLYKLITLSSFDKPYLAPFSPFIKNEQKDAIIKTKNKGIKYRNPLLSFNKKRGEYK